MCGPAIGCEINRVPAPHRKRVGVIRVRDGLIDDIILDVVDGDVLRQSAGVAFPLPEVPENPVVRDLGAVGRERQQATFIHGHGLRQAAVDAHRVWPLGPAVRSVATRKEDDALSIGRPPDHLIEYPHAVGERLRRSLVEGQLLRLTAFGRHHINVKVAVVLARECQPVSIGRKLGK